MIQRHICPKKVCRSTDEKKTYQTKYTFPQSCCLYKYLGATVLTRKSSQDMALGLEYQHSAENTRESTFMELQEQKLKKK